MQQGLADVGCSGGGATGRPGWRTVLACCGAVALLLQLGVRAYHKKPLVVFSGPCGGEDLIVAHQRRAQQWWAWA